MKTCTFSGIVASVFLMASVAEADTAWVGQSALNVRSGPGVTYPKVATLSPCARVEVLRWQGSWAMVRSGGGTAWVSAGYLRPSGCSTRRVQAEPPVVVRPSPAPRPVQPSPTYRSSPAIPRGVMVPKYMTGIFRG